jgi:hypothetical protein
MRLSVLTACLIPAAFVTVAAFVACGGAAGGSTTNPLDTHEPAQSSIEAPGSTSEPATSGMDSPPSSIEPGGTSGGDLPASGGGLPLCIDPPAGETACITCIENSCASQLHAVVVACSAFLDCFKACACTDETCISNCAGDVTSACATAATPFGKCEQNTCGDTCSSSSTVSINFGTDAGTVQQGSGPGIPTGGGSGCSALSTCCNSLSGAEQTGCNEVVSAGNATACTSELNDLQGLGTCD